MPGWVSSVVRLRRKPPGGQGGQRRPGIFVTLAPWIGPRQFVRVLWLLLVGFGNGHGICVILEFPGLPPGPEAIVRWHGSESCYADEGHV